MDSKSKTLIALGLILIFLGFLLSLIGGKIPLGKLPGDIRIETFNVKFYLPLTTSLLLSVLLSLLIYLFRK